MALLETFSDFTFQRFYFVMECLGEVTKSGRGQADVRSI